MGSQHSLNKPRIIKNNDEAGTSKNKSFQAFSMQKSTYQTQNFNNSEISQNIKEARINQIQN